MYFWNLPSVSHCFFFQAEDGIRDKLVTGVQTCALPISPRSRRCSRSKVTAAVRRVASFKISAVIGDRPANIWKIGRASCRERSVDLGGSRIMKKKRITERQCGK